MNTESAFRQFVAAVVAGLLVSALLAMIGMDTKPILIALGVYAVIAVVLGFSENGARKK